MISLTSTRKQRNPQPHNESATVYQDSVGTPLHFYNLTANNNRLPSEHGILGQLHQRPPQIVGLHLGSGMGGGVVEG